MIPVKLIGLIGGMSWESTIPYYRHLNESVKAQLGGLHSARILLYSVDFFDMERYLRTADWKALGDALANVAKTLEIAGVDFIVLATNTMHRVAPAIEAAVGIPLLHIVDPTASEIKSAGFKTVGLLGTQFTMEQDFFKVRLRERHGIEVIIPNQIDRNLVHRVIFEELCLGKFANESRAQFRRIMKDLVAQGAEAIILGCTEFAMLVDSSDSTVPLFDTTRLHACAAAQRALAEA